MQTQTFSHTMLQSFTEQLFIRMGCPATEARVAAEVLIAADLRGIDSHGVARLSGYVRLWEAKRINAKPLLRVIHETPSTAVVDGDAGLGLVVAPYAMKIAIEKAKNVGSGWVSVQNSNHYGIAAAHAMLALEHDMIGFSMTNASPLVAPTFSNTRMLGTNPICMAAPAGEQPPFVMDLATTTAANGKLEILQRKHLNAPEGWVQDAAGNPTTDVHILKKGGALLPLGSDRDHGSHKGYALGAMVDILSALLSGANYAPWVPPFPAYVPMPAQQPGKGIGHFFGAMRVDAFRPAAAFKKDMDDWMLGFRNAQPLPGHQKVLVPGDPEREMEAERRSQGIPLLSTVVDDLKQVGNAMGVEWEAA
ncbi:Ldh family oxidoreductase [Niabella insulamsoli]|uniref:Ldh family oxidoreductase n=1 Tax=Niabella insulamsoli TaxID=3144874 RepID=UPI0031FD9693